MSRGFHKNLSAAAAGPAAVTGEERGNTPIQRHSPRRPLRDSQEAPPCWLCPLCGAEQYCRDRARLWRGRRICPVCFSRLDKEDGP